MILPFSQHAHQPLLQTSQPSTRQRLVHIDRRGRRVRDGDHRRRPMFAVGMVDVFAKRLAAG